MPEDREEDIYASAEGLVVNEDITQGIAEDNTLTGGGEDTFGSAEDFVVRRSSGHAVELDSTRWSGIVAETDAIDDTDLLSSSVRREWPTASPSKSPTSSGEYSGARRTPQEGSHDDLVDELDDEAEKEDRESAEAFLRQYNLRYYRAENPFNSASAADDEEGDLTFSHIMFFGKDVPDEEELKALKDLSITTSPVARLIQRLICTNAIQRRYIREQNENWARLADAEREEDHRRVSAVQKKQSEAMNCLKRKVDELRRALVSQEASYDELKKVSDANESLARSLVKLAAQVAPHSEEQLNPDEAFSVLQDALDDASSLKEEVEEIKKKNGEIEAANEELRWAERSICTIAKSVDENAGGAISLRDAVRSISSFLSDAVAHNTKGETSSAAHEELQSLREESSSTLNALRKIVRSLNPDLSDIIDVSGALRAIQTFKEEHIALNQHLTSLRNQVQILKAENETLKGTLDRYQQNTEEDAIDELSRQSVERELNVRTHELDMFASYARSLDSSLSQISSAEEILDFFKSRIERFSEERFRALENDLKEYEELYKVENRKNNKLEDSFEASQAKISSLEAHIASERIKHSEVTEALEQNTRDAAEELEKQAALLNEKELIIDRLTAELSKARQHAEIADNFGKDDLETTNLKLENDRLLAKCSEFEEKLSFWKELATNGQGRGETLLGNEVSKELPGWLRRSSFERICSESFSGISGDAVAALARRIESLSNERAAIVEKAKQLNQELSRKEHVIEEMRHEFASELHALQDSLSHAQEEAKRAKEDRDNAEKFFESLNPEQSALSDGESADDDSSVQFTAELDDMHNEPGWDDKTIQEAIHSLDILIGVKDDFLSRNAKLVAKLSSVLRNIREMDAQDRTLLEVESRATLEKYASIFNMQQNLIRLLRGRTWSTARSLSRESCASGDMTAGTDWSTARGGLSPLRSPAPEREMRVLDGSFKANYCRAGRKRESLDRRSSTSRTFSFMKKQLDESRRLMEAHESENRSLRAMVAKVQQENSRLRRTENRLTTTTEEAERASTKFLQAIADIIKVEPSKSAIEGFCMKAVRLETKMEALAQKNLVIQNMACSLLTQKNILSYMLSVYHTRYAISIFGKKRSSFPTLRSAARAIVWIQRLSRLSLTSQKLYADEGIIIKTSAMFAVPICRNWANNDNVRYEISEILLSHQLAPQLKSAVDANRSRIAELQKVISVLESSSPLASDALGASGSNGEDYNRDVMKRKVELAERLEKIMEQNATLSRNLHEEYRKRASSDAKVAAYRAKVGMLKKKTDMIKAKAGNRERTYKAAIKFLKEKADKASRDVPEDETDVLVFGEVEKILERHREQDKSFSSKVTVYNDGVKQNDARALKLLEEHIQEVRKEAQSIVEDPWLKEQSKEYINGMKRAVRKIKRFADKHEKPGITQTSVRTDLSKTDQTEDSIVGSPA